MRRESGIPKRVFVGAVFLALGILTAEAAGFFPQEAGNYLWIPQYGIFDGKENSIYILDRAETEEISENGVDIRLLSAVLQNGRMTVNLLVQDSTVVLADEGEKEELKAREEEGSLPDGYFCLDEEKGIYASGYFEREISRLPGSGGVMWPSEAPDRIVSFSGTGLDPEYDYEKYMETGRVNYGYSLRVEREDFSGEGEYELALNGFGGHFKFHMEPAPVYASFKAMKPGKAVTRGPVTLFARASRKEGALRVELYRYGEDGKNVYLPYAPDGIRLLGEEELSPETGGGDWMRWKTDYPYGNLRASYQVLYFRPAEERESYRLKVPSILVETREKEESIFLSVPKQEEALDRVLEFEDFRIRLTSVRPAGEKVYGTRVLADGREEDMKKNSVYVSMEVENRDDKKRLLYPIILQYAGDDAGYVDAGGKKGFVIADIDTSNTLMEYGDGVKGMYLLYGEGQEEIEIRFRSLRYLWEQEFEILLKLPE